MSVKELKSKARELLIAAASLETIFHNAIVKYLNTIVSITSCNSDDTDGKACLEEICAEYNSSSDLVTIEYTIMNKYGDFVETKTLQVSSSEIDKYILK